jgi:hypothetical protein
VFFLPLFVLLLLFLPLCVAAALAVVPTEGQLVLCSFCLFLFCCCFFFLFLLLLLLLLLLLRQGVLQPVRVANKGVTQSTWHWQRKRSRLALASEHVFALNEAGSPPRARFCFFTKQTTQANLPPFQTYLLNLNFCKGLDVAFKLLVV